MSVQGFVTVPPEKPFLDVLAAHILKQHGASPEQLARVLVMLPTRRSCRSLRDILLKQSGGRATLLPRIQPIGDIEDEDLFSAYSIDHGIERVEAALPPALPKIQRQLMLTRLVQRFRHAQGESQDYKLVQDTQLAAELARLFDDVAREQLDFRSIADIVPADFAEHWQLTLRFLEIITREWPNVLKELKAEDPIRRRNGLIEGLAEMWRAHPPQEPIIVAGSTGSQPATAKLLQAVAGLPNGMVVLPALDISMPDDIWEALDETHPMFPFRSLFARLGIDRHTVCLLDDAHIPATCAPERQCLLMEALKPADHTATWRNCEIVSDTSLQGVFRIEAASLQEEAKMIAVMLREVLEVPGKTAAVVTRDRNLARMITSAMERYGVTVDDSAGRPLSDTPSGVFLRLIAECGVNRAAPVPLLALLKHPLAAGGMAAADFRRAARLLELALLRGPRPLLGIASLIERVQAMEDAPEEITLLLEALHTSGQTFFAFFEARDASFSDMLKAHLAFAEGLSATDTETPQQRLWKEEEGEALGLFFSDLMLHAYNLGTIDPRAYPGVLDTLLRAQMHRPVYGAHPRLHIFSPQEARLERADVMIVAGLNEGVWPPVPEASPWMSRPMQRSFGLPLPEQAVGRAAHDLLMIASAPTIVFTRAAKADGSPTVPSRWLLRMDTLLQAIRRDNAFHWPDTPYLSWLARLETPHTCPPFAPPAARPPVAARPRTLSVTRIEVWQRDPYAIYAAHVLKLFPLNPLDQEPDAAAFGTYIHRALESFLLAYPSALPADALEKMLAAGRQVFTPLMQHPAVQGFWWPRYVAIAHWVLEQERERRPFLRHIAAEMRGALELDAPAGPFTLTTRIDRAEITTQGELVIVDYKTGAVPLPSDIKSGLASQLPLEALIVEQGTLRPALSASGAVARMEYWKLSGEAAMNQILHVGEGREGNLRALITRATEGVSELIAAFDHADTPYLACPDPARKPRYNDYEQLERLAEWAVE